MPFTRNKDNRRSQSGTRSGRTTLLPIRKYRGTEASAPKGLRPWRPSRSGFLKTHIEPKVNFLDCTNIDDALFDKLKKSAERFAQYKGLSLQYPAQKNNVTELFEIIRCLNSQIQTDYQKVNLQSEIGEPKADRLWLTFDRLVENSYNMLSIQIKPTYQLRKEFGDVVRRFLVHLCQVNQINEIRDTPLYDSWLNEKEYYDDEMREDRNEDEEQFDYWFIKDYEDEDGHAHIAFKEIYQSLAQKRFDFQEVKDLNPENDIEKEYKSLLLRGEEFIFPDQPVTWLAGLPNEDEEYEISTNTQDTIHLTFDIDDDLYDNFYDWINASYGCTGISEGIINSTILTPDLDEDDFDDYPDKFIKYLIEIIDFI